MGDCNGIAIGCIGSGTMGGALMKAIARKFAAGNICVSDADPARAREFAASIGARALPGNADVARESQYVFLAVKPAYVKAVLQEVRGELTADKVVVSIAAGVTLAALHDALRTTSLSAGDRPDSMPRVVRVMPNLPATVGEAMIALCAGDDVPADVLGTAQALLESAGKVEVVPERLMDGVTAVSGSGPAYAFLFIEALADAAVRFGMPRPQAYVYAAQTLRGAATLALEDPRSISELKDAVCSPAGTTIEGVIALERHNFRAAVIDAATAAYNKSVELGRK